jgi:serine acetyltransferase
MVYKRYQMTDSRSRLLAKVSPKRALMFLVNRGQQVAFIIRASFLLTRLIPGFYYISLLIDVLIHLFYGVECTSSTIDCDQLIIGHMAGLVLGGNGIRCRGRLHVSSGVVFARKYSDKEFRTGPMFDIQGALTVGSNTVIIGPCSFMGDVVIGALSLVKPGAYSGGAYVGCPAKPIESRISNG